MKDTAIASLLAFAKGPLLKDLCNIRTLLLKQPLAGQGEVHKDPVLRASANYPCAKQQDIASSPAMRYPLPQLLAAVGKKG